MMKRTRTFILLLCLLALTSLPGIYAYFSSSVSVINHLSLGDVDISLEEYEMSHGKRVVYKDDKLILPGDTISKIPSITNLASPCYVRVKPQFDAHPPDTVDNHDTDFTLTENNLGGISDEWVKQGEYYYYTRVLEENSHVDFFHEVSFPDYWTESYSQGKLSILLTAEAIQAKNFRPDFTVPDPWFNQEIEVCVHDESLRARLSPVSDSDYNPMSVVLSGSSKELLAIPDDFFLNLGTAMPGDTLSDSATLSNTSDSPVDLYFFTGLSSGTDSQALRLMGEIKLSITVDGQSVYQGDLEASTLNKGICLGSCNPGEDRVFHFELLLPSTWKNSYALTKTQVKWTFEVRQDTRTIPQKPVQTGDFTCLLLLISLILVSSGGMIILLKAKRRLRKRR